MLKCAGGRGTALMGAVGLWMVAGGIAAGSAEAASWKVVGEMSQGRNAPAATLLMDGTVLVSGGEGKTSAGFPPLATAERFDPKTGVFTLVGRMRNARLGHAAVRLQDGRVLLAGGLGRRTAEVFDPATNEFTAVGDMSTSRFFPTATLLKDGRVLVVSGEAGSRRLATAELFDKATGQFAATGSLPEPRVGNDLAMLPDGRVLVVGGVNDKKQALASVLVYDPEAGTFSPHGELAVARAGAQAVPLPDGTVLMAGGIVRSPEGDEVLLDSIEVYDPASGKGRVIGRLGETRTAHGALLLPDGKVLVAGGWTSWTDPPVETLTAELIDPATGAVTPVDPTNESHPQGAMLLLADGRALIVGGIGEWGPQGYLSRTAELFVP